MTGTGPLAVLPPTLFLTQYGAASAVLVCRPTQFCVGVFFIEGGEIGAFFEGAHIPAVFVVVIVDVR